MTLPLMVSAVLVLLALGVPISFAMGLAAVIALAVQGEVPLLLLPQQFFDSLDSFALLAVPLFIFAGELMTATGLTDRIVAFAGSLIGHLRGGLAQVNHLAGILMAGISGSAAADTAAIGSVLIPAMIKAGYRKDFSVVVTASSGMLGPIIPPSILMIIYGSMTGVSIGALFVGGVVPGLLLGLSLMVLTWFLAEKGGARTLPRSPLRMVVRTFIEATPALLMPLIIVGGILFGVFTPTEAGGVAVLYSLILGLVTRSLDVKKIYHLMFRASAVTASALIVLGGAGLFSWVLAREGVAHQAVAALTAITQDRTLSMLIILAFLFFVGIIIEPLPAMVLIVPVLTPVADGLGFHPVHFGIVTVLMLLIGTVTPPVGVVAMLACRIADVEYSETYGMFMPYIGLFVAVTVVLAFVPELVLWLPRLMIGS